MKNILLPLAMALAVGMSNAQEQTFRFELGSGVSMTTYTNYPALSLFPDQTQSYTNWGEVLHMGIRTNHSMYGMQYQMSVFNMSDMALSELVQQHSFSLMMREYGRLGRSIEPYFGMKLGLSVMQNDFRYQGVSHTRDRMGMFGELELGIQYRLSESAFFGLRAGLVHLAYNFSEDYTLPNGLQHNGRNMLGGYNFMVYYGFNF